MVATALQDQLSDALISRIVLSNEYPGTADLRDFCSLLGRERSRRRGQSVKGREFGCKVDSSWLAEWQGQLYPKQTTPSQLTYEPDLTTHQRDQLTGDCCAEPGATIDTGNRVICLSKWLKNN